MTQQEIDELYMRRCLQLAANGLLRAKPNPMVGAVIVVPEGKNGTADGRQATAGSPFNGLSTGYRIIGEGYHVRHGEGHAEVNAFASVSADDEKLLPQATIYVSLEPCAHYGKTPPCADLIVSKGVRRCVVGCVDPFAKVSGRGIDRLREAGIEVAVGVLEADCLWLNRRFITAHTKGRPYITLKFCQTANGFIDNYFQPVALSSPFTFMLSHKLRAECDAIAVGRITAERDSPQLTVRHWHGSNPRRIVIGAATNHQATDNNTATNNGTADKETADSGRAMSEGCLPYGLERFKGCAQLAAEGCQWLVVEGGAETLRRFMAEGCWDELRVELSPLVVAGGTAAPAVPACAELVRRECYDGHAILWYRNPQAT